MLSPLSSGISIVQPTEFALGVLAIAAYLDFLIGDPWGWPHPVQAMGWVISHYSQWVLNHWKHPVIRRIAGIILATGVVTSTGFIGWGMIQGSYYLHPVLGLAIESILLASCFAGRSLRTAAETVLEPLNSSDLETARQKLSLYVGRDSDNLSESEVMRAVLETVTENAVDGVMAPLFYAIAGSMIFHLGALPLAFAYKAASTLDSMVGYRDEPYTDLGWFSAKLEDILTWFPCRLTVITLGLLSNCLLDIWRICQRDATQDPSPNSGWSECTYAVILGVQLGGINYYRGIPKPKPLLNTPLNPITPERIQQGMLLTRWCFLTWLSITISCWFLSTQLLS
jgi:adenosylcobinamide-phosphate synthase